MASSLPGDDEAQCSACQASRQSSSLSRCALCRCEPPVQADRNRLTAETSSGPARWEGALV